MKLFKVYVKLRSPILIKFKWCFKEWALRTIKPTFFKVNVCGEWVLCYSLWTDYDKQSLRRYDKINYIVLSPRENNVTGGGTFINSIRLINPVFSVTIDKITSSSLKTDSKNEG